MTTEIADLVREMREGMDLPPGGAKAYARAYKRSDENIRALLDAYAAQSARISTLERENASLETQLEAFEAKFQALSAHEGCACSYDTPEDMCLHHSPKLVAATARVAELERALTKAETELAQFRAAIGQQLMKAIEPLLERIDPEAFEAQLAALKGGAS